MVARITTSALAGIEVTPVDVQAQITGGLPSVTLVGLPDKAVAESRERVRAALHALGLTLPPKRLTINLAPADLLKEGSHFDLPIALAVLKAMEVIPQNALDGFWALGELALDGQIMPVGGVLPTAIAAASQGCGIICPEANGSEAAWAGEIQVIAPPSLLALINHVKSVQILASPQPRQLTEASGHVPDLAHVHGQQSAKRALEITAAGGHNLLMVGPPGSGKSMLASCLPGILPKLSPAEILEISMIQSVAGKLTDGKLTDRRPFRDPHHSSSMAAMVGGGRRAVPGEISLAHQGVLFLDELPEFPRGVLESLRQPLETGKVTIARVQMHVTYPANFQLVAAMNPCRCGYLDDAARACGKAPKCAQEYQSKLSGPLLDRFDVFVDVPQLSTAEMMRQPEAEPSAAVAERVATARQMQHERYGRGGLTNASAAMDQLKSCSPLSAEASRLLEEAATRLRLSMRGYSRVLRVARTIADMQQQEAISTTHLAEALHFRQHLAWQATQAA